MDEASDIPAPVPTPEGETPLHGLVSVWLDAVDHRGPYEEVLGRVATQLAGYSVVESLYSDYGGNHGRPRGPGPTASAPPAS